MKTYYSSHCDSSKRPEVRSWAESIFVLGIVGAICATLWVTNSESRSNHRPGPVPAYGVSH